ncbi:MAG: PAS domain S-box protein [Candidatus Cloacimonetes bacterium]|nr:PAS domain S-box protein [Candidatus Cloacimonadota bacterium]MBT4575801.1 PAS domain S-box protein [Candidatus Cloacimonadota bacterium]
MKKILIIDDQQENLTAIEKLVHNYISGCDVHTATTGKEGVAVSQLEIPDLILININLPLMDGFEICDKLKAIESTKQIPIIFLSQNKVSSAINIKSIKRGVNSIITIPIDKIELTTQIKVIFRLQEAEERLRQDKTNLEKMFDDKANELHQSEELYRSLFEESFNGIIFVTKEGEFVVCNNAYIKITGYSIEELSSMDLNQITPVEFQEWERKEIFEKQLPQRGHSETYEKEYIKKNGAIIPVEVTSHKMKTDSGDILYWSLVRDISERRKAEDEIKLLNNTFEDSINGFSIIDSKGKFVYANKAYLQMWGLENLNEIVGKSSASHFDNPLDHLTMITKLEEFGQYLTEYVAKRKNGTNFEVLMSSHLHRSANNDIFYVSTSLDVTDHRNAEKELRRSETRLLSLFNSMTDIVMEIDYSGYYLYIAPTNANLLFMPSKHLLGKKLNDIYPKPQADKFLNFIKECLNKNTTGTMEYPLVIKDKIVWFEARATPRTKSSVLFIARDVTIRKQAEEQIKKDLKEKSTLLQELYHRTKNNMQVISSMLKMQSMRSEDKFIHESFKEINNKIIAMSLVHQKLYRAQDLSNIDLKEYIEELVDLLMQSYDIRPEIVSLSLELEQVFVLIDSAVPLGLVLNELISNVFKHAFPNNNGGVISLRLYKERDDTIHIHVSDNGIGIKPDVDLHKAKNMGLQTMFSIIDYQLNAEINYESKNGLKWHLKLKDDLHEKRV